MNQIENENEPNPTDALNLIETENFYSDRDTGVEFGLIDGVTISEDGLIVKSLSEN